MPLASDPGAEWTFLPLQQVLFGRWESLLVMQPPPAGARGLCRWALQCLQRVGHCSRMLHPSSPPRSLHPAMDCVLWNTSVRGIEHVGQSLTAAHRLWSLQRCIPPGPSMPCKFQTGTAHSKSSQRGCSAHLDCSCLSGVLVAGVSPQVLTLLPAVLVDTSMRRLSSTLPMQWRWQPAQSSTLRQLWPQSEK